ncbi:MAG: hypothetical protein M1814_003538 [Vezdaea aestivalis]|nr:MAG: hypothetical protein M1814_003538 [Vezdaea aestivalis]
MVKIKADEVQAYIKCNGSALPEFQDPELPDDDQSSTVNRYVQLIPGAEFSIHFELAVDGYHDKLSKCERVTGIRPFVFSEITIVEGRPAGGTGIKLNRLGKIEIKVSRVRIDEDSRHTNLSTKPSTASLLELSEKELKGQAISHFTKAGPSRLCQEHNFYHAEDLDEAPIMTFNFFYRSRNLQIMGMIPRDLTPPPETTQSSAELQSRLEELKAENHRLRIKSESGGDTKRKRTPNHDGDEANDGDCEVVWTKAVNSAKRYKGRGTANIPISLDDD